MPFFSFGFLLELLPLGVHTCYRWRLSFITYLLLKEIVSLKPSDFLMAGSSYAQSNYSATPIPKDKTIKGI